MNFAIKIDFAPLRAKLLIRRLSAKFNAAIFADTNHKCSPLDVVVRFDSGFFKVFKDNFVTVDKGA